MKQKLAAQIRSLTLTSRLALMAGRSKNSEAQATAHHDAAALFAHR
jgi:hypothetical protein